MTRAARVVMALALVASAGCGASAGASGVAGRNIKPLPAPALQGRVAALDVRREDVAGTVRQFQRSYSDAIDVYSLRDEGLMQATLQVSRFADADRLRRAAFRRGLVDQLSTGTRAQVVRIGATDVNVTRATGQRLFVWFRGRHVLVLAVRDAYRGRYALLRAVIAEVKV